MGAPALTALVGFVSGVLSGAFGIGGGLVTTPAIRLLLGYPALVAVGTPLPVILPTALAGAVSYARRGLVDLGDGLLVGAVGSVGSVAGALLSARAGGPVVMLVTAFLILYVAVDLLLPRARAGGGSEASAARGEVPKGSRRTARLVALGIAAGLYSGFLGLGGGFVVVPVLTRWLGVPFKRALGTSLVVVAVLAVPGSIAHALLGHVDAGLAAVLIVGAVPGALLGARLTAAASERRVVSGFAVLLAISGLVLAWSEIARLL